MATVLAAAGIVTGVAVTRERMASSLAHAPPETFTGIVFRARPPNAITALKTTLTVPDEPPATGTLFLWPGLQPHRAGAHFRPIDNGVLQPVLTWGPSCANPGDRPAPYSTWWVSAQYVNTFGKYWNYTGCHGGPLMPVRAGDKLVIAMTLTGTIWTQTVTDRRNGRSVSFRIDMRGQTQHLAYFMIEGIGQNPVSSVVFTDTSLTLAKPQLSACIPNKHQPGDPRNVVSPPVMAARGSTCRIAMIELYAPAGPIRP